MLQDYFDPVGLERPDKRVLPDEESFSRQITVHTPDRPIRDLDRHKLAIFGVPEDRNGFVPGTRTAPDRVRQSLYQLGHINRGTSVYDLGNIKTGGTVQDTYYAIRDVMLELGERQITALLLGGSQDLGRGVFQAFEKEKGLHHILTVDSMLDFSGRNEGLNSRNYLDPLLKPGSGNSFSLTNLGHQAYFVTPKQLEEMEKYHLESLRLGMARENMRDLEPLIRDSAYLSIDMGAVRYSDAPGASLPSPNGFFGDELCQITRYAGLSEKVRCVGIFEFIPDRDTHGQTAHLAAQAAWYFLEGFSQRMRENPLDTPENMKRFIVHLDASGYDITFHKSTLSDRWWMEIPVTNPATGHNFFISCSYEDYHDACNQEIPDRWWRYFHRLGTE